MDVQFLRSQGYHVYGGTGANTGKVYITKDPVKEIKDLDMSLNFRLTKELAFKDLMKKKLEVMNPLCREIAKILIEEKVLKDPLTMHAVVDVANAMADRLVLYNKFREASTSGLKQSEQIFYAHMRERIGTVLTAEMTARFLGLHGSFDLDKELRNNMVPKYFWNKITADPNFVNDMSFTGITDKKNIEKCLYLRPFELQFMTEFELDLADTIYWFYKKFLQKLPEGYKCYIFSVTQARILDRYMPNIPGLEIPVLVVNLQFFKLPISVFNTNIKYDLCERAIYSLYHKDFGSTTKLESDDVYNEFEPPEDYFRTRGFKYRNKIKYDAFEGVFQQLFYEVYNLYLKDDMFQKQYPTTVSKDSIYSDMKAWRPNSKYEFRVIKDKLVLGMPENAPEIEAKAETIKMETGISSKEEEEEIGSKTSGEPKESENFRIVGERKDVHQILIKEKLTNAPTYVSTVEKQAHQNYLAKQDLKNYSLTTQHEQLKVYVSNTSNKKVLFFNEVDRGDVKEIMAYTKLDPKGEPNNPTKKLSELKRKGVFCIYHGLTREFEAQPPERKLIKPTKNLWQIDRTKEYQQFMNFLKAHDKLLAHNVEQILRRVRNQGQFDYLVRMCMRNRDSIVKGEFGSLDDDQRDSEYTIHLDLDYE
jgi:hypothetical protein